MHTVFDVIGKFRVVRREYAGAKPFISTKEVVLVKALNANQVACGKTALESYMKVHNCIRPHIRMEGLERVWFEDWRLSERKVKDQEAA